jgi:hypothetical protein
MNLVLDNTVEEISPTERTEIGMVVIRGSCSIHLTLVLLLCTASPRPLAYSLLQLTGNSVVMMEPLERL